MTEHKRRNRLGIWLTLLATLVLWNSNTSAAPIFYVLDFETDRAEIVDEAVVGSALVNGQDISSPPEFGSLVAISDDGGILNDGAAIFDSSFGGPNDFAGNPDPDLIVGLGNILILQQFGSAQTVPGIFDTPDDEANGGTLIFDFLRAPFEPVTLLHIDVIDINGNNQEATLTLTDVNGFTRVYNVPDMWTNDINVNGPDGYDRLDLTTLLPQLGEGGTTATATEDASFNADLVAKLEVQFNGSGGLDNLTFVPEPSIAMLLGLGLAVSGALRRQQA